jgi:hypothetical protein
MPQGLFKVWEIDTACAGISSLGCALRRHLNLTRWTKDKLVEAFRAGRKSIVIQWDEKTFSDLTKDHVSRLDGTEFLIEESFHEIKVHRPKMLPRGFI